NPRQTTWPGEGGRFKGSPPAASGRSGTPAGWRSRPYPRRTARTTGRAGGRRPAVSDPSCLWREEFRNRDAPHGQPGGDRVIVRARPNRAGSGRAGRRKYETVGSCMSDVSKRSEETPVSGCRPGHGEDADDRRGLLALALLSLAAGAVTGLV